jgi:hypothetical protein
MIRLPTDDELEQGQAILREQYRVDEPAPGTMNVQPLFDLGASAAFSLPEPVRFGPTPHKEGYKLFSLHQRIEGMRMRCAKANRAPTPEEFAQYQADVDEAMRVITRLAMPVTTAARIKKRLGWWNPLRDASEAEIGYLLGFLLEARKRLRIQALSVN